MPVPFRRPQEEMPVADAEHVRRVFAVDNVALWEGPRLKLVSL